MKIVFAGTPEFAAQAMRAIHDAGHEIVLVLTQPDRRAGRGMHLQASPVKAYALEKNIPVLQPKTLRRNSVDPHKREQAELAYQELADIDFDAMVVVAYGLILPQDILDIAERPGRFGSFNIHASLLPRWRGAAPIQRALEAGDHQTGVCIMQMDAGLDTGPTMLSGEILIDADETSASLHDKLAALGAKLIVETLQRLQAGENVQRVPQPSDGITYAEKILKSEAQLDWNQSAKELDLRIRAFNPFPGATAAIGDHMIKLWHSRIPQAEVATKGAAPGEILGLGPDGIYVQSRDGVIEVLEMQKPGGKRMNAKTCLQTFDVAEQPIRFQNKA